MRHAETVRLVAAAWLAVAAAGAHAAPDASFDQGVDVSAAIEAAKAAPAAAAPAAVASSWSERDCATFRFAPGDAPVSETVQLRSQEWVQECHYGGDPRHGGGRQCWDRPGFTYHERVRVTLRDRQSLLPWESDSFRVCLQGPWLDIDSLETAYEYKLVQGGSRNGEFVLSPVRKTPMKPDPAGLLIEGLSAELKLALRDKWASYYAAPGERLVLKLTVKEDVPNWANPTVAELTLSVDNHSADRFTVDLLQDSFGLRGKVKAGKKYYVKVQFQRKGTISKGDTVAAGESAPVKYQPVLAGFAAL